MLAEDEPLPVCEERLGFMGNFLEYISGFNL